MASQKYSGIFQSNFDPGHRTLRKERDTLAKKIKKDAKKNGKFKDKRQYVAIVSK
jgi:hypothetical protein